MINPVEILKEKTTRSIEAQIQSTTNDLIDSAIDKTISTIKGRIGYETVLTDSGKIKKAYKLIEKLNPEKFKENSIVKVGGGSMFSSSETTTILRSDTTYIIKVPNTKAYMQINYRYEELSLYLFGIDAASVHRMTQKYLQDKTVTVTSTEKKRKDWSCRVYSMTFDEDNEIYCRGGQRTIAKDLDSIYTDNDSKKHLIDYIDKWEHSSELFDSLGISHTLGILLYGEPGTGKTSISKTIAAYLDTNLYTLSLNKLKPEYISEIRHFADEHANTIILLEDVDYIFGKREKDFTQEQRVAGQTLLQLLDGAESMPRTIFIATTNDIDALDEAITRDGRFDLKINMTNIDKETAEKMCSGFHLTPEQTETVLQDETFPINPAYLQNKSIQYIFSHLEEMNYQKEGGDELQ